MRYHVAMSFEDGNGVRRNEKKPPNEYVRQEIARLETSARQFATEQPETAIWLHDHFRMINMRGLRSSFKNVIERAHGNFDPERLVPFERTYVANDGSGYLSDAETIKIHGPEFVGLENEVHLTGKMATLIDLVCHENAHAIGRIAVSEKGNMTRYEIGYSVQEGTAATRFDTGILFNEGVTELVSQRVTREYLIGYPLMLEDGSVLDLETYEHFLDSYHLERGTTRDYAVARDFVRVLSMHVAKALSTKPGLVEDALVAGYFRGTEEFFNDPDFLDGVLGPGFSGQLRSAQTADDLEKIIHEYQMPPIATLLAERIERLLRKSQERP